MNITRATGLTPAQVATLKTLGGVRPIFRGLVEHEKPICLRTPENVVRTPLGAVD